MSVVVWIGFLPKMQFIFARLMFMHCHALLILFLFPEPFFSFYCVLYVSLLSQFSFLTMAPKKFIPSKNPITCHDSSSTSTSSQSIPDRVQFRHADSQKDFIENFHD